MGNKDTRVAKDEWGQGHESGTDAKNGDFEKKENVPHNGNKRQSLN